MKQFYYERIRTERVGVHQKRKALGTKHIYVKANIQIEVFYNAQTGHMTEAVTGVLFCLEFGLKANEKYLCDHFEKIAQKRDELIPKITPLNELEEAINNDLLTI